MNTLKYDSISRMVGMVRVTCEVSTVAGSKTVKICRGDICVGCLRLADDAPGELTLNDRPPWFTGLQLSAVLCMLATIVEDLYA